MPGMCIPCLVPCESQKRAMDPLELELQKVVIIRKAETWSFARAARAANH